MALARPHETRLARWLGALSVAAGVAAGLVFLGRVTGFRSFVFAFELHFLLMFAASLIDVLLAPELDSPRFDVAPREVALYRRLGVIGFMRLLQRIGWTGALRDPKVFDGTRATLASYERATRHGENNHIWLFLLVLAPLSWAVVRGWWDAALYLGSMNVVFHLYPILLQRTQRARLRGLLERGARAAVERAPQRGAPPPRDRASPATRARSRHRE